MNERYLRWYSPWLSREFEILAFGNGGGLPLIMFPTSFGSYYQNKDFGLVGSVSEFVCRESYGGAARTQSIWKAFTTNQSIRLIVCVLITRMKT
jgi:hypothetical protein